MHIHQAQHGALHPGLTTHLIGRREQRLHSGRRRGPPRLLDDVAGLREPMGGVLVFGLRLLPGRALGQHRPMRLRGLALCAFKHLLHVHAFSPLFQAHTGEVLLVGLRQVVELVQLLAQTLHLCPGLPSPALVVLGLIGALQELPAEVLHMTFVLVLWVEHVAALEAAQRNAAWRDQHGTCIEHRSDSSILAALRQLTRAAH
mmetsp:Transcript_82397/g.209443  ORF Transcript_82397/g.209443 Transcript_82397/m.209443 type:complete len:202 (+) Transcript_82397:1-606(+)